jgi:hypothetical protein
MDEKTLALLDKPFTIEEHGYVDRVGFYILKSAIHRRLREIDPHFRTTAPEIMLIDDDIVVMKGGLTLLGDTRHPVGTGKIDRVKWDKEKKQDVPLTPAEIVRNRLKAIKQAASDLLPRGAALFGIGDYMRDVPKDMRTKDEFPGYLRNLMAKWERDNQPPHWALNGGGKRVQQLMSLWELPWSFVAANVEGSGQTLAKMSETTLSEVAFIARLPALREVLLKQKAVEISTDKAVASVSQG